MIKALSYTPVIACIVMVSACSEKPSYQHISGETMGTSYHISYQHPDQVDQAAILADIDSRLDAINKSMSTYDENSTISRFNRLPSSATPITIDADFQRVLLDSQNIYQASHHAFDPTVHPLVELWGFGGKMQVDRLLAPPSDEEITQAKTLVGLDKITLKDKELTKNQDGVGLDFSAIAKGYAVDVIAKTLRDNYQIKNYMVEIGGEVATLGKNDKGRPWRLAIDTPLIDSSVTNRQSIATLTQPEQGSLHIATSGGYRNSIEYQGKRYSHTINPATAYPVADSVPSITVLHDSVSMADGWATALTALPADQAWSLATEQGIAAVFVLENDQKTGFMIKPTPALTKNYPDALGKINK